MKFLSALILLLSILALANCSSFDEFKVTNIQCTASGSINDCTNLCGVSSFKVVQSGNGYVFKKFIGLDCPATSVDLAFNCNSNGDAVTVGVESIVCTGSSSSASPLTAAVLSIAGLAAGVALL
ncbi:hypothetical protein RB653_006162 [Dictyostelium firmibasis]|uniref:Uncharacterized protein n=1 Tax=Dictyostelium firmibasis TaxID=79012 RepID=A0AAN7U2A9_9MYCE